MMIIMVMMPVMVMIIGSDNDIQSNSNNGGINNGVVDNTWNDNFGMMIIKRMVITTTRIQNLFSL